MGRGDLSDKNKIALAEGLESSVIDYELILIYDFVAAKQKATASGAIRKALTFSPHVDTDCPLVGAKFHPNETINYALYMGGLVKATNRLGSSPVRMSGPSA